MYMTLLVFDVNLKAKFVELLLVDSAWSVEHDVAAAGVLRERDDVSDAVELYADVLLYGFL